MKSVLVLLMMILSLEGFSKELLLKKSNTVTLRGPVTSDSINSLMLELREIAQEGSKKDPIYLVLNTPGGSVFAGIELMNYVNQLRRPVHVVANFAASMGFHILQNSPVRYVTPFGIIMSHRVSGGFQGELPGEVTSRIGHILQVVDKMDEKVVDRTSGKWSKKEYQKLIADEYWATGSNAIKDGFADEIATIKCDKSLNGSSEKQVTTFMGFTTTLKFPDCPIFTQPDYDKSNKTVSEDVTKYLTTIQGYVK